MIKNKQQTKVSITGLTYNSLLEDVYNALRDSEFKDDFTDFTSSTAERMIAELFCYIAQQLSDRMDQMGNELFTDTASIEGLSRLLKTVGYKLAFPNAASVLVEATTSASNGETLMFSPGIDPGLEYEELTPSVSSTAPSFKNISLESNNNIKFEFIDFDEATSTYDYCKPVTFTTPYKKLYLYGGRTTFQTYTIRSIKKNIITLKEYPVINNSVEIYYKKKGTSSGSSGYNVIRKFLKVDNFFSTEALTCTDTGYYTVNNLGNGKCEIVLQPNDKDMDAEIIIMYRIGGGSQGNISIGAINNAEQRKLNNGTTIGTINYYNISSGIGGADELTADEIRYDVSQNTRNSKIAITEEDYEYIMPNLDPSISLLKCCGEKNTSTENLATTYGYYLNPLNVWLLILKYVKDIEDAYNNNALSRFTKYINDIAFETLDLTHRFNENYSINEGFLNQLVPSSTIASSYLKSMTSTINLDQEAADILASGDNIITITSNPYIETKDLGKRGYHSFEKYEESAVVGIGDSLPESSALYKNKVWILTSPYNGERNTRWECAELGDLYAWHKVDFSYYYDNFTTEAVPTSDIKYIRQTAVNNEPMYLYSVVDKAFTADCGSSGITLQDGTTLTINGKTTTFSAGTYTAGGLATKINGSLLPMTWMATLKDNIPYTTLDASSNIVSDMFSDSTLIFTQGSNTININKGEGSDITYADLMDTIDNALSTNNIEARAFLLSSNNNCSKLVIVSTSEFTVSESSSDYAAQKGFLTDYLKTNGDTRNGAITLTSTLEEIGTENSDLDDYAAQYTSEFVTAEGNTLVIRFDEGTTSTTISSNSQDFISLFVDSATSNTTYTAYDRRTFTLIYNPDSNSATLTFTIANPDDRPTAPLYINIFGSTVKSIMLGQYYVDIENTLPEQDRSEALVSLLKRAPLTSLYSTKYLEDESGNVYEDKYASDYQVKFSTNRIIGRTFHEIDDDTSSAKVTLQVPVDNPLRTYSLNSYLYFKADATDFQTSKTYTFVVDGVTHTVPITPTDGYATIDLYRLSGLKSIYLVNTMMEAYAGDSSNLLATEADIKTGLVTIRTESHNYASSIDFGNTEQSILSYLFNLVDTNVVTSSVGSISPVMIEYKKIGIAESGYCFAKTIGIALLETPSSSPSYVDVNTGNSIADLKSNISDSVALASSVIIDNFRLIFTDRINSHTMKLKLSYTTDNEKNAWKAMFILPIGESWEDTGTDLIFTMTNIGDYYIERLDTPDSYGDIYQLVIENSDAFPYGNIYIHMFEDYSYDHLVAEDIYTDEYRWNELLNGRKVMLTEHLYKQPRFIPFDLSVTCYIPNKLGMYKVQDYKEKVENFLRNTYGVYSDNIGQSLYREDIIMSIREGIPEITKVEVNYFGEDMEYSSTDTNMLEVSFNQKLIIASNEIGVTSDVTTIHGLIVNIKYESN